MTTARCLLAVMLVGLGGLAGCAKKADSSAGASANASAVPAAAGCPGGSTLSGPYCSATGTARVATVKWAGPPIADKGPTFNVTNTTQLTLKGATVSLWFYDKTGKRLDVTGAKKYSTAAAVDAFGSTPIRPGETRNLNISFSGNLVPTGAVELEAEIVKATIVKADGTDGPIWRNEDLNADARDMSGTIPVPPSATATAGVAPAVAYTAPRPTTTAATPAATATTAAGGKPKPSAPGVH